MVRMGVLQSGERGATGLAPSRAAEDNNYP
jgi:hypothetical protein